MSGYNGMNEETVLRWNDEQKELREGLPSFLDALRMAQNGNREQLDMYYYYEMKIEKHYYDNKKIKGVNYYLVFMDTNLHYFIQKMKRTYCDTSIMATADSVGNNHFSINSSTKKFDIEEVETFFIQYLIEFVEKSDLSKFEGENELHTYHKVIDYIKKDFENNVLRKTYNDRMGIKRVQVDNQRYTVKNYVEDVFIEDIGNARNKQGESTLDGTGETLNIIEVTSFKQFENEYSKDESSEYIFNNYREVLTKKQLEKLDKLLDWVNAGNNVEDLFEKNNPQKLSKSALSKILMPDRDTKSTMTELNNFIKSMKKRMNDSLEKNNIEDVRSTYAPLINASQSQNKLFKEYQLEKFVEGYESKFPISPIYIDYVIPYKCHTPKPFITKEDIQLMNENELSVNDLLKKYGVKKNELVGRNSSTLTLNETENEDDTYLEIDELYAEWLLDSHLKALLERIWNKNIGYTYDAELQMMVFDSKYINPIPTHLVRYLEGYTLSKGIEILRDYYNKGAYDSQPKKLKVVNVKGTDEVKERPKYLTPNELQAILNEKNIK